MKPFATIGFLLLLLGFAGHKYLKYREATPTLAPCVDHDALAAFLKEHVECTGLSADSRNGLKAVCFLGDYAISDTVTYENAKVYESFIFTNLRTMQQGVCDCGKAYGVVCEWFE